MAELPDWTPLDAVAPPSVDGQGRIVGVVASQDVLTAGWGPSVALDLARSWSARGQRVILADAGLETPSLHGAIGIPNREGVVDAALHGASMAKIARPVDGGAFFLVTAGTPVADADDVVRSGRWHRMVAGAREAGATLMLYVRDDGDSAASFLGAATDVVVLARPGEGPPQSIAGMESLVRSVTGSERRGDAVAPSEATSATSLPVDVSRADPGAPAAPMSAPAARATSASGRPAGLVAPTGGGFSRAFLFLVLAILAAAGLGYLLTAVL